MRNGLARRIGTGRLLGLCLVALVATPGCEYRHVTFRNQASQHSYKLTTSQQAPFAPGIILDVDTSSGSIAVTGTDAADCTITATITGHAPTEDEARQLAEATDIEASKTGQTLRVRADKPEAVNNRGVSVSYVIAVPRQASLVLRSAYGSLNMARIEGSVHGRTGSGSVTAEAIRGTTDLDTSYGSISCTDVVGKTITLHSGSGSITATDIEGSARIESSYGSLTCERMSGGSLALKSGSGRIEIAQATFTTCDAETSYGSVTVRGLQGDTLKCQSGSGSIDVSDGDASAMDLSTSYGRVRARGITTADLRAVSSSGSVEVICSPACPPDLTASARSAYGSVTFTAPPGFAGRVTLASGYGPVETDLPVTITGRIGDKKRIEGTVGQGSGSLALETSSGSVTLR